MGYQRAAPPNARVPRALEYRAVYEIKALCDTHNLHASALSSSKLMAISGPTIPTNNFMPMSSNLYLNLNSSQQPATQNQQGTSDSIIATYENDALRHQAAIILPSVSSTVSNTGSSNKPATPNKGIRAFLTSKIFGDSSKTVNVNNPDISESFLVRGGVFGVVRRTFRRHLLNWEREPHWVNARDDESSAAFARSTVKVRDVFVPIPAEEASSRGGILRGIRNTFQRVTERATVVARAGRARLLGENISDEPVATNGRSIQHAPLKFSTGMRWSELAASRVASSGDDAKQLRVLGTRRLGSPRLPLDVDLSLSVDAAPLGDLQRVVARLASANPNPASLTRPGEIVTSSAPVDPPAERAAAVVALRALQEGSMGALQAVRRRLGTFFLEESPVEVVGTSVVSGRDASFTAQSIEQRRDELLQAANNAVNGPMRLLGDAASASVNVTMAVRDFAWGFGSAVASALRRSGDELRSDGQRAVEELSVNVRQLSPRDVSHVLRSVGLTPPIPPIQTGAAVSVPSTDSTTDTNTAAEQLQSEHKLKLAEVFPLSSAILGFFRPNATTQSQQQQMKESSAADMQSSNDEPIGSADVAAYAVQTDPILPPLPAVESASDLNKSSLVSWTPRVGGFLLRIVPGLNIVIQVGSFVYRGLRRIQSSTPNRSSVDELDNALTAMESLPTSFDSANRVPFPLITSNTMLPTDSSGVTNVVAAVRAVDTASSAAATATSNAPSLQLDETLTVKMGSAQDLRQRPVFFDKDNVPVPTKADFAYIQARRVALAVSAASAVNSPDDAQEFLRQVGLPAPTMAALQPSGTLNNDPMLRVNAIKGLRRLLRHDKAVVSRVIRTTGFLTALCDMIEAPLLSSGPRGFFQSVADRERQLIGQKEAMALLQRVVRTAPSDDIEILRGDQRLSRLLASCVSLGEPKRLAAALSAATVASGTASDAGNVNSNNKKKRSTVGNTTVTELHGLAVHEMARVVSWGIGGYPWKPRQPATQRGLRILSFDGGGTRGVLSIALLKELLARSGLNPATARPCEHFDVICGTSTGGIIAALFGLRGCSIAEAEVLYDSLIDKVFGQKSNLKLVTEQAFYDENSFERVLYDICGEELLIDSNQFDCPRVFCVSTRVNHNPPLIQLWRNYNYPPGYKSRYSGSFTVNTVTAVRATTAAPTFFTPVQFEGGLFCDGALVANNPTAIALQEVKVLYPNVPVEMVVSVGTGFFNQSSNVQGMGWDLLVNHLIASSTDTEDVHALLNDFMPSEQYFRLNSLLKDVLAIDERNKTVLTDLKRLAKRTWDEIDTGKDREKFEQLTRMLRAPSK